MLSLTLALCLATCKVGPTEPRFEGGGDPDYYACPRGTSPWGQEPINQIEWWCELPDGGLHGPYAQWWPSETVRGTLGPRREGLRVKGWYEHGERVGLWLFWAPDGGLIRREQLRARQPKIDAQGCASPSPGAP